MLKKNMEITFNLISEKKLLNSNLSLQPQSLSSQARLNHAIPKKIVTQKKSSYHKFEIERKIGIKESRIK